MGLDLILNPLSNSINLKLLGTLTVLVTQWSLSMLDPDVFIDMVLNIIILQPLLLHEFQVLENPRLIPRSLAQQHIIK